MEDVVTTGEILYSGKKKSSAKKPDWLRAIATHPPYAEMITEAIRTIGGRKGTSHSFIVKHLAAQYQLDTSSKAVTSRINKALRFGVNSGLFKQMTGTGATGSFRLGEATPIKKKAVVKSGSKSTNQNSKAAKKTTNDVDMKADDSEPTAEPAKKADAKPKGRSKKPVEPTKATADEGKKADTKTTTKRSKKAAEPAKTTDEDTKVDAKSAKERSKKTGKTVKKTADGEAKADTKPTKKPSKTTAEEGKKVGPKSSRKSVKEATMAASGSGSTLAKAKVQKASLKKTTGAKAPPAAEPASPEKTTTTKASGAATIAKPKSKKVTSS